MIATLPFGGKLPELINRAELDAILENPDFVEGLHLEYRRQLPPPRDPENHQKSLEARQKAQMRFLKTVSAFANTDGGYLIVGIQESNGIPQKLVGCSTDSLDSEMNSLWELLEHHVTPRVSGVRMTPMGIGQDHALLLVYVDSSPRRPHMVRFQSDDRFYGRDGNRNTTLDVEEIRSLFLASGVGGALTALVYEIELNLELRTKVGHFPVFLERRALDGVLPYAGQLPEPLQHDIHEVARFVVEFNSAASAQIQGLNQISERNNELIGLRQTFTPIFKGVSKRIRHFLLTGEVTTEA